MEDSEKHQNNKLKPLLIAVYLFLAFGTYFILFGLSRIARIKGLLGL
ncbi:MAG: hypothetical protein GY839_17175 [candidate division Zixibacteria bacterium]|nr:hypothetical protein [candidate division Zixibacteria bacterium]